jgi:hypothetical protein
MARQAAGQLDTVERATVYDAIAFTPPAGDTKNRAIRPAWFDVVVLVETASPVQPARYAPPLPIRH